MKKILLLFLISLILTSFNNATKSDDFNIVGKWKGVDESEVGYLVFLEENYAYLEVQGQIIGGKDFEVDGKKGSMTYVLNYSTTPIQLDLITTRHETKKTLKLLGIIDIINKNKITVSLGFSGSRPASFDIDKTLTFKRVE